jgi:hypothetical protein
MIGDQLGVAYFDTFFILVYGSGIIALHQPEHSIGMEFYL